MIRQRNGRLKGRLKGSEAKGSGVVKTQCHPPSPQCRESALRTLLACGFIRHEALCRPNLRPSCLLRDTDVPCGFSGPWHLRRRANRISQLHLVWLAGVRVELAIRALLARQERHYRFLVLPPFRLTTPMTRHFQFSLRRLMGAVAWLAVASFVGAMMLGEPSLWGLVRLPAVLGCCAGAAACLTNRPGYSLLVAPAVSLLFVAGFGCVGAGLLLLGHVVFKSR